MEIKSGRKAADVRLFIAMPALDGRLHCPTAGCLLDAQIDMVMAGISQTAHTEFMMQDSNLPFSRNRAVAKFMATDCTDLIMVDADMSWSRQSFMRLICHPVDFVGASYRQKIQNQQTGELITRYAVDFLDDEKGVSKGSDPETGLLEVKRLPAGFLRVTRRAIQRMISECGVHEYQAEDNGKPMVIHRLFANEFNSKINQEVGEDYTFCDRWRSIGGKVWCDPELSVSHHGLAVFHGHLGGHIRDLMAKDDIRVIAPVLEAAE
jgi:hypothetical protein